MKKAWVVAFCLLWSATAVGSETKVHAGTGADASTVGVVSDAAQSCSFDDEPDRVSVNSLFFDGADEIAPDKGIRRYATDAGATPRFGLEQNGRRLTPPIFDNLQLIGDSLIQVARGSCQGVIDIHGASVLPLAYASLEVDYTGERDSVVLIGGDKQGMQLIRIAAGGGHAVQRSGHYVRLSRYRDRNGAGTYWSTAQAAVGAIGLLAPDLSEVLPPRFDSIKFITTAIGGIEGCPDLRRRPGADAGLWLATAGHHVELLSECGQRHAADAVAKLVELRALNDGPSQLWPWNTLVGIALESQQDGRCVYLDARLAAFANTPRGVNGCRGAVTGSGMLAVPGDHGDTQLFRFNARGEPSLVGRFAGQLYMQASDFIVLKRGAAYAVIDAAGRTPFGDEFEEAAPGCGAVPVSLRRGGLWYSLDVNTRALGKGTPGKPFFFSC